MSYSCNDNIVLFIGNPREGDRASVPNILRGIVCAFDEIWMIDLLNEFCLRDKWTPLAGASATSQQNITERLNIGLIGTPNKVADLRTKLDKYMQEANRWHRGQKRNNSIWLYNQFTGEDDIRRSLIYNITSIDNIRQYPTPNNDMAIDLTLNIERHFCWENQEYTNLDAASALPYWGTIDTPTVIGSEFKEGTEPARIALNWIVDLVRNPITRRILGIYWTGIKEDIGCGLDTWSPLWECETGTDISGYANTNTGDPSASGGFRRDVVFPGVGTAMTTQIEMSLQNAFPALTLANYDQFRGDYIVLIRAKLSNSLMTVPMTIRYGWVDAGRKNAVRQSPVIFTGEADWRLIELGVISLPVDSARQALSISAIGYNNLSQYSIDILAGLDASGGAGTLYLDALYLIPFERHAKIRYRGKFSPSFASNPTFADALWLATHEDDTAEARYLRGEGAPVLDSLDPISDYILESYNNYALPERGSRIVQAVNAFDEVGGVYDNVNDIDWDVVNNYQVYPRWLSYRTE